MKRATVKDIAQALNLSVGTIYRALSDDSRVNAKTKKLVIDYANSVGFQPNASAQGLAKRKKHHIVFLDSSDFPEWWALVRAGAEKAAQELSEFGVKVTALSYPCYFPPADAVQELIGLLDKIQNNEVDGIVLVPSINREIMAAIDLANVKGIPVACINADAPLVSQRLFYYGPDEEKVGCIAGELVGKLLRGKGNVALVGVDANDFYRLALRKKGFFQQVCQDYPNITIAYQGSFPSKEFRKYLCNLLETRGTELDAIYVTDSISLEEAANIVKEYNLRNISVIGHEMLGNSRSLIQENWIKATICQETFSQGYYPLKIMYHYLLSKAEVKSFYYSNVNIVIKSNLDYLKGNEDGCGFL